MSALEIAKTVDAKGLSCPMPIVKTAQAIKDVPSGALLEVLATDRLVSLPQVSVAYANSAIPIGAVLFVVGQLLVFPEVLREARRDARRVEESA